MTDTVRVRVNTEAEEFPALGVWEIGNPKPGEGFEVPRRLWRNLGHAQEMVDRAETAIMEHVAARYPDARAVHEWLAERNEPCGTKDGS